MSFLRPGRSYTAAKVLEGMRAATPQQDLFGRVVDALRRLLAEEAEGGVSGSGASALAVDFRARRGKSCGFYVYGFSKEGCETLIDHSLGASYPPESRAQAPLYALMLTRARIGEDGIHLGDDTPRELDFTFQRHDSLVFSSHPLHYDPHWPPAAPLDTPAVALAASRGSDMLLGIWTAQDEG